MSISLQFVFIKLLLAAAAQLCTVEKGYYQCAVSDQCFAIKFLCDGTTHCSDGSDEGGLCNETCTPRLCGHECHATPTGPLCYCREGYALDANNETCSGRNCADLEVFVINSVNAQN